MGLKLQEPYANEPEGQKCN